METFELRTRKRVELLEITDQVQAAVSDSGVQQGLCVVYCPHTTAALTVNENADPDVVHDVLSWLSRSIPKEQPDFRHAEGNSDSHLKACLVGPSVTLLVEAGRLVL